MTRIILASKSPRRIEILREHGFEPEVIPAHIEENLPEEISPEDAVMFLSLKKALWVEAALLAQDAGPEDTLIIASDTIVYKDRIIGKPADREDAYAMLDAIRGDVHQVYSGVALIMAGQNRRRAFFERTDVFCKDISEEELLAYIDTPEPYDKAGGYAIQGTFGKYIDHIEGDYENVVGFPYPRFSEELQLL